MSPTSSSSTNSNRYTISSSCVSCLSNVWSGDQETIGGKVTTISSVSTSKAFGNAVPDPIARLLNVSETNFQSQHDPSYWLVLSPGEVAKRLNKIVDLEIIDRVLANVASRIRRCRDRVETAKELLVQSRRDREELAWVPEAVDHHQRIVELRDKVTDLSRRIASAASLLAEGRKLDSLRRDARDARLALATLVSRETTIVERDRMLQTMKQLYSDAKSYSERCTSLQREREVIDARLAKVSVCPLCGKKL